MKCAQITILRLFLSALLVAGLYSVGFAKDNYSEKELVLPDLNGKQVKASDYKGKWVIVNYWATWCPPCAEEIPELNAFHIEHSSKDAVVLGVNIEKDELDYVKEFVEEFKISYPVLQSNVGVSSPYGRIQALPTTFILDKQGKVMQTIIGAVTQERLESILYK